MGCPIACPERSRRVSRLLRDLGVGPRPGLPASARHGIRPETCGTRAQKKWPRIGGAIKRGAALCQLLVSCDHSGGVKLLGEIISAFSPQNSSSTEKGVWTRRESNPHLHFDREPCYRCTTGPEQSLWDGAGEGKSVVSYFMARVPNWNEQVEQFSLVFLRRSGPSPNQRHRHSGDDNSPASGVIRRFRLIARKKWGAPCLAAFARHGSRHLRPGPPAIN
jgi:hypothetical protein